jgi:Inner membrane protein YgaP-like, transmembrane domain
VTRNIETASRMIRIIVGLAVLSLTVMGPNTWWGLLGVVPLVSGVWGW